MDSFTIDLIELHAEHRDIGVTAAFMAESEQLTIGLYGQPYVVESFTTVGAMDHTEADEAEAWVLAMAGSAGTL